MDELDPIEDSLIFSQRYLVERMARDRLSTINAHVNVLNVITALDALGLLNRSKVREEFRKAIKPRETDNG